MPERRMACRARLSRALEAGLQAIWVYHPIERLCEIPRMVHAWGPRYRSYLRKYQLCNHETVMHATRPERRGGRAAADARPGAR